MSKLLALAILALAGLATAAQQPATPGYVPPNGFVPDSATATRIAEAVWIPIYGEQHILSERPFVATLDHDVWTVTGTLGRAPAGMVRVGGTAVARIAKLDGRILFVTHYR